MTAAETTAPTCWCGHGSVSHSTDAGECRVCFCSGFDGGAMAS